MLDNNLAYSHSRVPWQWPSENLKWCFEMRGIWIPLLFFSFFFGFRFCRLVTNNQVLQRTFVPVVSTLYIPLHKYSFDDDLPAGKKQENPALTRSRCIRVNVESN